MNELSDTVILKALITAVTYSASSSPLLQKDKTLFGLQSIRFRTFRKLMCVCLVMSAIVSGALIFYLSFIRSSEAV